MKFSDKNHIFFDLDHTLWDFDRNSGLAFKSVFQKNRVELELERFLEVYAPINSNYWKLYRENKVTKEVLRHGRLRESFLAMDVDVSEDLVKQLAIDYIDHLPNHNFLLDGTIELLEYLYPRYILHIITNGFKEVQKKKLENSGILKYFTSLTTSEDVGVKKPDPEIFEVALRNASAEKDQSIMIGDNFEADVMGAINFGMEAILFNYYDEQFSPEFHQVREMKELAGFL